MPYKFRNRSPETIARQRAALMRRLGIPEGHRKVYGVFVPEDHWEPVRSHAALIAERCGYDSAHNFVLACKASKWVYDYTPPPPPTGARGEYWADWVLAKALYEEGTSVQEIASFYNMDIARVERARRRKWKPAC